MPAPCTPVHYCGEGDPETVVGHAATLEEAYNVIGDHAAEQGHVVACVVEDEDQEGLVADSNRGHYRYRIPGAWPTHLRRSDA